MVLLGLKSKAKSPSMCSLGEGCIYLYSCFQVNLNGTEPEYYWETKKFFLKINL